MIVELLLATATSLFSEHREDYPEFERASLKQLFEAKVSVGPAYSVVRLHALRRLRIPHLLVMGFLGNN